MVTIWRLGLAAGLLVVSSGAQAELSRLVVSSANDTSPAGGFFIEANSRILFAPRNTTGLYSIDAADEVPVKLSNDVRYVHQGVPTDAGVYLLGSYDSDPMERLEFLRNDGSPTETFQLDAWNINSMDIATDGTSLYLEGDSKTAATRSVLRLSPDGSVSEVVTYPKAEWLDYFVLARDHVYVARRPAGSSTPQIWRVPKAGGAGESIYTEQPVAGENIANTYLELGSALGDWVTFQVASFSGNRDVSYVYNDTDERLVTVPGTFTKINPEGTQCVSSFHNSYMTSPWALGLYRTNLATGAVNTILQFPPKQAPGANVAWGSDRAIYYLTDQGWFTVPLSGGTPAPFAPGLSITYLSVGLGGSRVFMATDNWSRVWSAAPDGTDLVDYGPSISFAVNDAHGVLVIGEGTGSESHFARVSIDGKTRVPISDTIRGREAWPKLTADGTKVFYTANDGADLYVATVPSLPGATATPTPTPAPTETATPTPTPTPLPPEVILVNALISDASAEGQPAPVDTNVDDVLDCADLQPATAGR